MVKFTKGGCIDSLEHDNNILVGHSCCEEYVDCTNNEKFELVIGYTLKSEGGYSNSSIDRGGETKYGITKSFMLEYKSALPGGREKPIKEISVDDAKRLYKAMWDRYKLGCIRDKNLVYVMNDYMINSHAFTVVKRIQRILNKGGASLRVDGCIGPKTLEAIHNCDTKWLIDEIIKNRQFHYRKNVDRHSSQKGNYAGWINRLNAVAEKVGSMLRYSTRYCLIVDAAGFFSAGGLL